MQKAILLGGLIALSAACQHERDIAPDTATLAGELTGTYRTNGYLSIACIALPDDKMPVAEILTESDNEVTLVIRSFYPAADVRVLNDVRLSRQPDNSVRLLRYNQPVGTFRTDRIFTDSGMEKQGQVLSVASADGRDGLTFIGYKH